MYFYKLELSTESDSVTIIEEILIGFDAISISIIDKFGKEPIYEPKVGETPLWKNVKVSAIFEREISIESIHLILENISFSNLSITKFVNKNWIEIYQKDFQPIQFGQSLFVVPSWHELKQYTNSIQIKMDPGMAFGSGSHETTHLCLEHLDSKPPKNLSVMDFGCGSGILGIASLLLGASRVIAVDIDPQALLATEENALRNGVTNKILTGYPDEYKDTKSDVLIANILANPLVDLKDQFMNLTIPQGRIVLSGIMDQQLNAVLDAYQELVEITRIEKKNNWCLVEGIKIN
ncbi:50S ribosomal protein L11 methyltransferase [Gammaproteobacteria bacterium]|nr:50S ribosomal protein L11 methyltransferase [Gammaproteobacteria bacterium]